MKCWLVDRGRSVLLFGAAGSVPPLPPTVTAGRRPAAPPVATLFPGYFAMLMATGIIAVAASQQGIDWLAQILYVVAVAAYVVLAGCSSPRVVRYPLAVRRGRHRPRQGLRLPHDRRRHERAGRGDVMIHGWYALAWVLWWSSVVLWAGFLYATLIAVVIRPDKPGLQSGINGSWFLLTVSTESIAVLAALLLAHDGGDVLGFAALAFFPLGVVLYVIVMTMVFLRWTFMELDPTEADPPVWIAAGAVAITVLAGSNLLLAAPGVATHRSGGAVHRGNRRAGVGDRHVLVPAHGGPRRVAPLSCGVCRCATTRPTGRSSSPSACTAPPPSGCARRSTSTHSNGWPSSPSLPRS